MKNVLISLLALAIGLGSSSAVIAKEKSAAAVPFYFKTNTLGNTLGVAGVMKGVGQPQAALFAMGLYSDKDSYLSFLSASNYAIAPRWLVNAQMYQARFNDNPYYIGQQGSNDASTEDKTITDGLEANYKVSFKYIFPWGSAAYGLKGVFTPKHHVGFASPQYSGITSLIVTPFYSSRKLDIAEHKKEQAVGITLALDWDNRDSVRNTTWGSHTALKLTAGAPELSSDETWTKWEFENSQYFSLGSLGPWFDQQVLALDFYTANTPTWNALDGDSLRRPPEQEQVRLGGLYRLRGYTAGRYHDRSAIHYSMEYRAQPYWQPLNTLPIINYYHFAWWQWVAFAEMGRVADNYNLNTLHDDMKWDVGGGVRFQVEGVVVRAELAKGGEESTFRVMINQPF